MAPFRLWEASSTADLSLAFDLVAKDKASGVFSNVGKSAEGAGKKMGAAFKVGALLAAGAAVKFGKDSVSAFAESETAQASLSAAFAKFPQLAGYNVDSIRKLNTELAKKTRYDDDATASGQAVLASFKLTGDQIKTLTPLLQDYATKTGKDLPTAASDLGKAVLGQGRSLKEVGIKFTDTGTAAGNLAELQAGLRAQVGGFAEKEGKTAAGQAQILGNRFGEIQETIGSKLVPALLTLAGGLGTVLGFVERNSAVMGPLVGIVGGLAAAVFAVNKIARIYTATQAALNLVMSLNPIGLVVIAIAALAAGLFLAYKKSETFRAIVQAAFTAVTTAAGALWAGIQGAFRAVVGAIQTGISWFGTFSRSVGEKVSAAVAFVRALPGRAVTALAGLGTAILNAANTGFGKLKSAASTKATELVTFVKGIPAKVTTALGDLGSLLFDAGAKIVNGLIDGIKSKVAAVGEAIGGVAGKIRDFLPFSPAKEGPLSGRGSPFHSGLAISSGVASGILAGHGGIGSAMARMPSVPALGSAAAASVGAGTAAPGRSVTYQLNQTNYDRRSDPREAERMFRLMELRHA